jgi:hypothetical protein
MITGFAIGMIMKLALSICCLIFCMSSIAQVVYKTVKADGTVVYSGVNSEGATPVKLSAMNSVVMPALNQSSGNQVQTNRKQADKAETKYSVSIISPQSEQTLRNNAGMVTINAQVQPKSAGKFQLLLDEQIVTTQTNGQFNLDNVDRGAHNIEVHFLDNSGKILARSKVQTFYLHQASALINAN